MVRLIRGLRPGWYILEGDYVSREGLWTPMDWDYVTQEFSYRRRMLLKLDEGKAGEMAGYLSRRSEAYLYRVLSHQVLADPLCPWQGDSLYDAQCVWAGDRYYTDAQGLRVFCSTRLSPMGFRDDVDNRVGRDKEVYEVYDHLREHIRQVPGTGKLAPAHVRLWL